MTTKTITFDPIPDGGEWSVSVGSATTGSMNGNGHGEGVPANGTMEDESIEGRLRKSASKDLAVSGDYAGGIAVTFDPSLGELSVSGTGLYKEGGEVAVARVRAGENGYDGVREQQAIEVMGSAGFWDLGHMSIPYNASAAAVEFAVESLTQQGVSVEKVAATYYITWDEPGPQDMLPTGQGSVETFSHQRTAAGEYSTPGVTEVQTITLPECNGGEWDLFATPLPHDASAGQVDAAVTEAQVSVQKAGRVYTVEWAQPGPRELLPAYGSMLHVVVGVTIT